VIDLFCWHELKLTTPLALLHPVLTAVIVVLPGVVARVKETPPLASVVPESMSVLFESTTVTVALLIGTEPHRTATVSAEGH
jgi:hypothetical protein